MLKCLEIICANCKHNVYFKRGIGIINVASPYIGRDQTVAKNVLVFFNNPHPAKGKIKIDHTLAIYVIFYTMIG